MRRVIHLALLLAVVAAGPMTVLAAQQPTFNTNRQATFVMKNGERHSGTLVYHNDNNFNLIENGQERAYPIDQVAVVDFAGGDPAAAELKQLPTSGNPPELRRHMLVLRDGRVVHGKLYTIKENALTIDPQGGGREDFDLSNVARLYVSAPASRQLYAAQLGAGQAVATAGNTPASIPAGAIQVDGSRAWTDTGVTVRKGDRLGFSTTGQIAIRSGDEAKVSPDGSPTERDPGAPVPALGVGGLVGRVGTGAPFPIGSSSTLITMPANGRLYLGINDKGVSDNSGAFIVTIVR
jgi:hypothetical protein